MALTDSDARKTPSIVAGRDEQRDSEPFSAGFRARLDGLSLYDLIQMECLARARRVVRVASVGRVGYLYFQNGEIFHATTKTLVGERAALEMLEWTDGTFEPCNIAWPEKGSIKMGWQNLLLGAATAKDESAAGNLVLLPSRRAQFVEDDVVVDAEELEQVPEATVNSKFEGPLPKGVQRAVRVDSNGDILSSQGEAEDLAGFAAYAARVGDLVGQVFGLGPFSAMDLGFKSARSVLLVEDNGDVVVVETASAEELNEFARSAGL